MTWWQVLILSAVSLSSLTLILNKKLVNLSLIKDQLNIYYKYSNEKNKKKVYWFDILCFLVLPLAISAGIVWGFDYKLNIESTNTILTVTSILFSVLFTVLSIITSKSKINDSIERKVVQETFCTITTVTIWFIASIVISIVYSLLLSKIDNHIVFKILTNIIFAILIHSLALLLVTIKRFYLVFTSSNNDKEGN